ncbi:hypothetical protein Mlab_0023 [Methanocorpusculum labreanum Z]|uniref:Zinc ribbon domain-containing protein n=1 Tax=Methanocorpusculum labreanum (strain ATCC 43576 / DSM 4855 / Z) TaxID=410358 RepID=A2SPE5_METLZ|nr:hypothetical protein [Methanocorpusculum labreanum]ABN06201.1 hypothetical protein Mlab_0023 [Methanocorpusculum labreanum Z]
MGLERSVEDQVAESYYKAKITRGVADRTFRTWFSKGIKAPDLAKCAEVSEMYLIYLPFWRFVAQGKAVACGYSEYTEQTGNVIRNIFEELIDDEFIWTECACDTGKYGIEKLWLDPGGEVPYVRGSVVSMEPGGSAIEASKRGREAVHEMIKIAVEKRIDRITLKKSFLIPKVFELVYAPVWIAHYSYKGGHYTAIVDAVRGEVLGGTSPINLTARTRMMILSLALGGIMIGSSVAMLIHTGPYQLAEMFQIILLLLGIAMCMAGYPAFKEGRTFVATGTMTHVASLRPAVRVPKQLTDQEILNHDSTILQCPLCGEEVEQPWGEVITPCKKCSHLLDITANTVKTVPYDVAKPDLLAKVAMEGVKADFIPFWRFDVDLEVTDKLTGGDTTTGLPDISGKRSYYICAADIPRYLAEPWEIDMTIRNPEIVEVVAGYEGNYMPILINNNTARELTEFLYLRYETEKPGILQVLRYNFTVENSRIVYIPYYKEETSYIPGI